MTDENKPSPEIASPDQESGEAEHYFALLDAAWETVVHYARVNVDEDIVMFNTAKNAIRALLASRPQPKEPLAEASGAKDALDKYQGLAEMLNVHGYLANPGDVKRVAYCLREAYAKSPLDSEADKHLAVIIPDLQARAEAAEATLAAERGRAERAEAVSEEEYSRGFNNGARASHSALVAIIEDKEKDIEVAEAEAKRLREALDSAGDRAEAWLWCDMRGRKIRPGDLRAALDGSGKA